MNDENKTFSRAENGVRGNERPSKPVEKVLEASQEAYGDLEAMRRQEAVYARKSFALNEFSENGGQCLLQEFGTENVLKTLQEIYGKSRIENKPLPDLYDLFVALEGDRKKRAGLILSMQKKIQARLDEFSNFYAGKGEPPSQHHRDYNWGLVRLQEDAIQELKIRDLPVVGKVLNRRGSLLPRATEGLQIHFIEQGALAELMDRLNSQDDNTDVLAASEAYYEKSRELLERRALEAREKAIPLTERIQEITAAAWAEFGEKVLGMLEPYEDLDETAEVNPFETRVKQVVIEAIQKEVDELEKATVSKIERETDALRKMLKKIELSGHVSCFP